jgi:hypothetical protein
VERPPLGKVAAAVAALMMVVVVVVVKVALQMRQMEQGVSVPHRLFLVLP